MYGFKKDKQIKRIEKQIKEFENYLRDEKGLSEKTIEVHIRNLREFYRFYLEDTNITLVDINADMVEEFIMDGIIDMFFHSKNDLSSNITTLRKFVSYLKKKKYIDAENYNKITDILKNKDYYIEKFVRYKDVIERKISFEDWFDDNYQDEIVSIEFEIDKKLKNIIDEYILDENNSFITDFDTYIDYIAKNKVKVTKLNKYIQRKHLLNLNDMMINSIEVKKTVNQIDIPILHLFYKFGVDNFILTIDDKDNISISSNISKYDELSINEKIAVFIDYIWNKMDWNEIGLQDIKEEYQNRKEFAKILARLETCRYYDYENVTILHRLEGSEANIFGFLVPTVIPGCMHVAQVFNSRILKYFSYLGLLEISFKEDANVSYKKYGYDIDKIKVSKFGKEIFKYLGGTDNLIEETKNMKGKVINLFSRKKIKK
ncbi:Phage integrase, N-terminal SAM-like domain [Caloranaerobacter azorensis DSM 13643]|uniref:Phage integrase, N-terminal SAM-like domain n=1 Tax=Caloranaerobacter azorensis DSM 13643 TaxID=1121264 RepID=A0A1M5VD91_9FIRM|nr:site-specific integrase [Caloranaerobacter azorensis]SHH73210.1 Phage integrase, N-terminal SAM-like domain [Caloranaerobacter azorensis DSM 13643]